MRLGARILLLTLFITIGSSLVVIWIVTLQVTRYESQRANDLISLAINSYIHHLDAGYQQVDQVVHAMLEAQTARSQLQAADDPSGVSARAQLREEIIGHDLQTQLQESTGEIPAFHVLINQAAEVVTISATDSSLIPGVTRQVSQWHANEVMTAAPHAKTFYAAVAGRLFLIMDFPLREQLDSPPTHAYFVGFPIDNNWVQRHLLADMLTTGSTIVPLEAAFELGGNIVASGTSDPAGSITFQLPTDDPSFSSAQPSDARPVAFELNGNRFLGQAFDLGENARPGQFFLVSSLNRALVPLHHLQRSILLTTIIACAVAFVVCEVLAQLISRPIQELAAATKRVAAGEFDLWVRIRRRDELGALAASFNAMAAGLKDRDVLQQHRTKSERDLTVAREIQMNVLPRNLPPCTGYDLAVMSQPAEQTGGDIYDLVSKAPDAPLVVLLADATGHGIGAALSVTQVRSMLRIGCRLGATTDDLLKQINQQLVSDLGASRFVTAFLGVLDPSAHQMVYHSAGQGPLLFFHAKDQRAQWLDTTALPLGIDDETLSDGPVHLDVQPGDLIVLLTDGYYEHQNDQRELFGADRIVEVIRKMHRASAAELIEELSREIQRFAPGMPPLDDMTAVVIRRDG